ncbi:MAG: hypothetical protein NXI31_12585 [bacterium]|nr:hypothetical protein [bacterium]
MSGFARLALALVCSPVLAQQTWVVDPNGGGDFTDLQVAFNTVSAGDTVLVRDGNYTGVVTLDKPLTVIGDSTAGVDIWWLRVGPLTTPGHVVIASLNVGAALALDAPVSLDAVDCAYVWTQNHSVLMRECRFGPNNQSAPGLHVASGDVVVQNCVLRGAPSTVWITRGCNVSGSHPALRVQGGTVTVANSNLAGIHSAPLYCPHYPVYGYPFAAAVVAGGALPAQRSPAGS